MLYRTSVVLLAALALVVFLSPAAIAKDKVHEGKVVKAGDGQLTMTDKAGGANKTHKVPATATITCDNKECKLEDLKEGVFVKVTMGQDETTVTKIEASTKEKE
jgi:hypothetical protein